MAARAASSAVKGRHPTLRRVCSLFSRPNIAAVQSTDFPFRRRIIKPVAQLISKRETETEVEKALRTDAGEAFVNHSVLENLQVSTKKEVNLSHNDKPIFYALRRCHANRPKPCFTALSLDDDGKVLPKYDIFPPIPSCEYPYGYASICNGIFCFAGNVCQIFLWNPATNESKILPQSQTFAEVSPAVANGYSSCEIWVDDKSQDYKVMRFIHVYPVNELGHMYICNDEIELYSPKTDSWQKISCAEFCDCEQPSACINGVYYMTAYRKEGLTKVILTFDFSTESISYLPLPDIGEKKEFYLLDYNGLLSILSYVPAETETYYEHWVMRNGSWRRLSVFHTCNVGRPLGFSRNGELLFFNSLNDHQLLVFDSATGKLKHLDDCGPDILELIPFSESFVKLNGVSELEEHEKEEDGRMIEANDGPLMV